MASMVLQDREVLVLGRRHVISSYTYMYKDYSIVYYSMVYEILISGYTVCKINVALLTSTA